MIPVILPGGSEGRAFYVVNQRGSSSSGYAFLALLLVSLGVVSFVTARSLARPLAALSRAAERFGAGDWEARAGLRRSDEIGSVARAFDVMAARIADLVRSEKELLANVSHELRTPLARIRVALDLAAEGDANVARQSLGEIAEDLAELEQLISDVLAAARLDLADGGSSSESGVPPLHRESVVVADLVERTASRFRGAHPDRPLSVDVAADLPVIEGDPVLLRRALDNLLENAHKYSRSSNVGVAIAASVVSGDLHIAVRDRGIGIAPQDLAKVFRPFFRADQSRARKTGGLGLGLALVKRIAIAHQGDVEIESHLGEGTCVRLRLPIEAARDPYRSQIKT
jgi:signal transduction histidine kinase